MLSDDSFTFVSYGNGVTKWLDHVIGRNSSNCNVIRTNVLYDNIGSDNLPLITTIGVSCLDALSNDDSTEVGSNYLTINWENLSSDNLKVIDDIVVQEFSALRNCEVMSCLRVGCRKRTNLHQLSDFYSKLCNAVSQARALFIRRIKKKKKKKKRVNSRSYRDGIGM